MALSMDEQRANSPRSSGGSRLTTLGCATCLTAFRRPGSRRPSLRSPRARIVGSLFTVLLVAMVSLMVYAVIPFRTHGSGRPSVRRATGTQGNVAITATGNVSPPQAYAHHRLRRVSSAAASATSPAKSASPRRSRVR